MITPSLGSFVFSEPALSDVGADVVFAVNEVGVDAGFLESCFNSFLNLLFLSLFNSHVVFRSLNFFSNAVAVYSNGVHRGNLHSHVAAYLEINTLEVEACDGRKVIAEVVVGSGRRCFEIFVAAEFDFFAGFGGFVGDVVGYRTAVEAHFLEFVERLHAVSQQQRRG